MRIFSKRRVYENLLGKYKNDFPETLIMDEFCAIISLGWALKNESKIGKKGKQT